MMPQINISTTLYSQLQSIAEPFVDTPETVIQKAVEFYLSNAGKGAHNITPPPDLGDDYMKFPPHSAPNLAFTRVLSIELDGVKFEKQQLYWNPLLFELVRLAALKFKDKATLKGLLLCNHADGKGPDGKGYRYIPEGDISVQGQAANPAWRSIINLAQKLGVTLDVIFEWEDNPKAQFPGKTARIMFAGA